MLLCPHMPTALITGASSGIGRDLALESARAGYDIIAVARNEAPLTALAETIQSTTPERTVRILRADLMDPAAPLRILDFTSFTPIDLLINNAGIGMRGFFHEMDTAAQMDMLQLNVNALTHLTRLYLPLMIERRRGHILNVASTAAFQPGPLMSVYYATKAYVLSLSEALHNEAREFGVVVTALCPGPTATEFGNRAQMEGTKLFQGPDIMTSAEVARLGFEGMKAGKSCVIPGTKNALIATAVRFVPRQTAAAMARSMQEKKPA